MGKHNRDRTLSLRPTPPQPFAIPQVWRVPCSRQSRWISPSPGSRVSPRNTAPDSMTPSAPPVSRWRRLLAVLLSFSPGCGHVLLGRWRRGLVWLGAILAMQAALPLLGFAGLVLTVLSIFGVMVDVVRLPPRPEGLPGAGRAVLGVLCLWALSNLVTGTTRRWLTEPFRANGRSMLPTLIPGDVFYTDKRVASPWRRPLERGEVILFRPPPQPDVPLVMRVVALEGETVALRCGRLSIDGREVQRRPLPGCAALEGGEPACEEEVLGTHPHGVLRQLPECPSAMDVPVSTGCPAGMEAREAGCRIPTGHVFVLGDNRDNAFDSRSWGPLPLENVVASAHFIYFSWTPEKGIQWARIGTRVR